jgi:hypothetical protein
MNLGHVVLVVCESSVRRADSRRLATDPGSSRDTRLLAEESICPAQAREAAVIMSFVGSTPSFAVEWLALLPRIRGGGWGVLSSNLDSETD